MHVGLKVELDHKNSKQLVWTSFDTGAAGGIWYSSRVEWTSNDVVQVQQ